MSEVILGWEIPPDVRLYMLEGKTFEEVIADLPNRPDRDIEFGVLVLSRHPLFEALSKMMTITAVKHKTSKAILEKIESYGETKIAEASVDSSRLPFLKECHALCVEFHVRAVNEYKAKQSAPGNN